MPYLLCGRPSDNQCRQLELASRFWAATLHSVRISKGAWSNASDMLEGRAFPGMYALCFPVKASLWVRWYEQRQDETIVE